MTRHKTLDFYQQRGSRVGILFLKFQILGREKEIGVVLYSSLDPESGVHGCYFIATVNSISALLSPVCAISSHQEFVAKKTNKIEEFCLILKN